MYIFNVNDFKWTLVLFFVKLSARRFFIFYYNINYYCLVFLNVGVAEIIFNNFR